METKCTCTESKLGAGFMADAGPSVHRLADKHIDALDLRTMDCPVIVIHSPRRRGCTSLIGALLAGLPGLQAAVALTFRAAGASPYMHGILPKQMVKEKDPLAALRALISMQSHARRNFPAEPLPKVAIAMDDVFDSKARALRNQEFTRALKVARDFNITVILATADASLLPMDVHTFATHVFATEPLGARELKLLHERLFMMYTKKDLEEDLALCAPHEFLVACLQERRNCMRSFLIPDALPVLAMAVPLVEKMAFALDRGSVPGTGSDPAEAEA